MPALYSSMSCRNRSASSSRVGFLRTASSSRWSMFFSMALAAVRLLAAKRRASCSKSSWLRSISGSAPPAERMMYSLAPTERSSRSDTESITLLMSGASDDDSIFEAIERITATR